MKKIVLSLLLLVVPGACILVLSFRYFETMVFETISVEGGSISGTVNVQGDIHIFKGIPFAAPPVGDLRWKEPQPVVPWSGVRKCEAFSASPMQFNPSPFGPWSEEWLIPKEPISEDCLYLNVWTGAKKANEKRAVIVWIYGGGFISGGAGVPVYDGEAMAKKGIVFVSINYRLGVFGFFAHPDLSNESGHHASGNYGLMDQIAALKWVQKNIASFGGDPNNVTVAGQSAGSMSVNCLVASPLCKGLFHRAIAESGAAILDNNPSTNTAASHAAEDAGVAMAKTLNANSINDLRKIPATELSAKARGQFRPIVDGYVLPEPIAAIFSAHKQNDVPVLEGWNEDDGVILGNFQNATLFKQQAAKYGADSSLFLKYYPASTDEEAAKSEVGLSRDMIFGIQNYTWGNVQSETGKSKIYIYRFTRKLPATGEYKKYGAFHSGELPYAYDNLSFVHRCPWEPVDHELANTMSTYWANFAKTGDPNGNGLPNWPAYNTKDRMIMFLRDSPQAKPLPDKEALDFLIAKMK